jgi:predicted nucleic acid-binding protein
LIAYLDSSALLRVLLCELGPAAPLGEWKTAYASPIAEVETFRALDRARLGGRLSDTETARKSKELADLLAALSMVPVSREVIGLARATFPVAVRALDALHVATAQWLERELEHPVTLWTHDRRQAEAALCRGLHVEGVEV